MKFAESLLAACLLGLAGFIGAQSYGVRAVEMSAEAAGAIETRPRGDSSIADTVDPVEPADFGVASAVLPSSAVRGFADAGRTRERRRRISLGASGTYIDELLALRDSALARWPDRSARPLRVWVDDTGLLAGWNPDFASAVRDAFSTWSDAGIPVRFDFVRDSGSADVHVRFTDHLPNGISGKTVWSRDAAWWLVSSEIALALVHPSGGNVTPPQMRAIALHEVGHLLGLDHATAPDNIMSARVRVRELSDADRATVALLYSVPAGTLKDR